jgi:hypothetical protein
MDSLYEPVGCAELGIIQTELLAFLGNSYAGKPTHAQTYSLAVVGAACPEFLDWLGQTFSTPPVFLRFYITAPMSRLTPHIDGGVSAPRVDMSLNFPVSGTKGTYLTWYEEDPENIKPAPTRSTDKGGYTDGFMPKTSRKLEQIDQLEVLTPHFVKTSMFHGVENPSPTGYRIVLTVRWIDEHTGEGAQITKPNEVLL